MGGQGRPILTPFQSAPLTKARGDLLYGRIQSKLISFNPLPSQKQGETKKFMRARFGSEVSIRSPHKSKGRRPNTGYKYELEVVSIRSPHKSKGRLRGNARERK